MKEKKWEEEEEEQIGVDGVRVLGVKEEWKEKERSKEEKKKNKLV